MKKLIRCAAAIALAAAVVGIALYFALSGANPAKKMMKKHPYSFETEKALGTEKQNSYTQNGGCFYIAYPKTKNSDTDQELSFYLKSAKEQFDLYIKENKKEKELIPQFVFDYKTKQIDENIALTCFYTITSLNKDGKGDAAKSGRRTYYLDQSNKILTLDELLGENSEKKINLMLKNSERTTDDLESFAVDGDKLTLYWATGEKELSVHAVERGSLIDPDKPMIALTFDDGPGKYSRQFADLLAKYNGHGTFFVLGMNVPTFSESLKYVYDMGNEIGSHTMRHKNLNKLTKEQIKEELENAAEAIHEAIGANPTLVRTPYGNANEKVMSVLNGPMISWSLDTEDWKSRNAQAVKNEILSTVQDGDIVLMHEIYQSTYDGLAAALEELSAQGYQFVTVSELMQYRNIDPEQKIYHNFYKVQD